MPSADHGQACPAPREPAGRDDQLHRPPPRAGGTTQEAGGGPAGQPGGAGWRWQTRLAIRAASELGRSFAGGAWLVELADVRDPALVGNAVMAALDLRDQAAAEPLQLLLAYLRDKDLLLVVDNCEHLLGAAAELVSEVLTYAPTRQ